MRFMSLKARTTNFGHLATSSSERGLCGRFSIYFLRRARGRTHGDPTDHTDDPEPHTTYFRHIFLTSLCQFDKVRIVPYNLSSKYLNHPVIDWCAPRREVKGEREREREGKLGEE